jgi:hypothetical protein
MSEGSVAFAVVVLVAAAVVLLMVRRARARRAGGTPRTQFGPPLIARILFFVSGCLGFAALWNLGKANSLDAGLAFAFVAFCALLPGLLGGLISYVHGKRQQTIRDLRADTVLAKLRQGEPCQYSLYLRAFETTRQLPQDVGLNPMETRGGGMPFEDVETLLARAMEGTAPLIALGRPGEQQGAGRVETTEEEWKDVFSLLASHAKVLILLPSANPGTRHEIGWISTQQFWAKTVLLMPQRRGSPDVKEPDRGDSVASETHWEAVRSNLKEIGLELPQYRRCGIVFKLDTRGHVKLFQPLGPHKIQEIIFKVVNDVGLAPPEPHLIECGNCGYCERWAESSMVLACSFCGASVFDQVAQIDERRKAERLA